MKKVLPLSALAALALAALAGQAQAQMPLGGRVGSRVERLQNQMSSKDPSVHYDPSVLKVGTPRNQVLASFDNPNASHQSEDGAVEDVYAFFPGGAKYADPQVTAGTIAAAVFTGGMSLAVRQARIVVQQNQLTLYRVHYDANQNIQSVQVVAPASLATPGGPPAATPTAGGTNENRQPVDW